MTLLIDIGNTTVAVYEADIETGEIKRRYKADTGITEDFTDLFKDNRVNDSIDGCIICSVVPAITDAVCQAVEAEYNIRPHLLHYKDIPMKVNVDEPEKVGMDRLVDAYYVYSLAELPAVTVDLGTATTIGVITEEGFCGGSISAGVETAMQAIGNRGAQLFCVEPSIPTGVIGKNTMQCLNIGAVCGSAALVDGMTRYIEEEIGHEARLYVTGGNVEFLEKYIRHPHNIEKDLLAKGMILLCKNIFGK